MNPRPLRNVGHPLNPTLIVTRKSTALGLGLASLSQLTARTSKRAQSQRVQFWCCTAVPVSRLPRCQFTGIAIGDKYPWSRGTVWFWYRPDSSSRTAEDRRVIITSTVERFKNTGLRCDLPGGEPRGHTHRYIQIRLFFPLRNGCSSPSVHRSDTWSAIGEASSSRFWYLQLHPCLLVPARPAGPSFLLSACASARASFASAARRGWHTALGVAGPCSAEAAHRSGRSDHDLRGLRQ